MDTKKAPPNTDPIDIAESLDLKLDLLDLAFSGLATKCEAHTPDDEEDIRPIQQLIWEAQAKSRELTGWVREARSRLKEIPAKAA